MNLTIERVHTIINASRGLISSPNVTPYGKKMAKLKIEKMYLELIDLENGLRMEEIK